MFREQNATSGRSGLREAMGNVVGRGNQELQNTIHIRCRCGPGNEICIVVTYQGKGFDFGKAVGNSLTSEPAGEHGRGIELKNVALDEVSFKRGSTEIHNGGTGAHLCFIEADSRVR